MPSCVIYDVTIYLQAVYILEALSSANYRLEKGSL